MTMRSITFRIETSDIVDVIEVMEGDEQYDADRVQELIVGSGR